MKITEWVRGPMVRLMNNKIDSQLFMQAEYGPDDVVFVRATMTDGSSALFECKIRLIDQSPALDN